MATNIIIEQIKSGVNMAKIKNEVWSVFWLGLKLYLTNFGSFLKYMAFPVFGQLLGLILTIGASYLYAANLPKMITPGGLFDNFSMIFIVLFLICLPGLLIFAKALWDYLVAYGAVNSMLDNMLKSGHVYDFPAHTALITRRTAGFVGLWLLFSIFTFLGLFPLFWIIAGILFVYFVLIFQVFTFEPDKSPFGCFQKSSNLISGNFAKTAGLMVLVGALTYWGLPALINLLFNYSGLTTIISIPIDSWTRQLPIDEINKMLINIPSASQITSIWLAREIVSTILSCVLIGMTLPLRSICWGLWYKSLNKGEKVLDKKILDRAEGKVKEKD